MNGGLFRSIAALFLLCETLRSSASLRYLFSSPNSVLSVSSVVNSSLHSLPARPKYTVTIECGFSSLYPTTIALEFIRRPYCLPAVKSSKSAVHKNQEGIMNEPINPIATNTLTRRNVIVGTTATLVGLGISSELRGESQQAAPQSTGPNATRTSLHQEVDLKSSPARIYAVLLDSKQFAAFSQSPADIHNEAGGSFSLFGARILGRNIELVPNQRIVQAWRSAGWDPGVYSIVRFEFKEQGTQTKVILDHTGFAEGEYDSLTSGWKSHYWDPLQLFFP